MLKKILTFAFAFSLLNCVLLNAQEAAPAAPAEAEAVAAAPAEAAEGAVTMEAAAQMSYDEIVALMSSMDADAFGAFVADAVNTGNPAFAGRVVAAANQVIAGAEAEKAAAMVAAVEKNGGSALVVKNNAIRLVQPVMNSILKKFDAGTKILQATEIPPVDPAYSAGATR